MIKTKKGQMDFLSDTALLIFIVLLLIIFFVVSAAVWGWSKKEAETIATADSLQNQAHFSLHAFLQKPVEIEIGGQKQIITISDLIRLSKIDSSYKTILDKELEAFDPYYNSIFRTETQNIAVHIEALEQFNYPRFYIPSNQTILAVLQIEGVKK